MWQVEVPEAILKIKQEIDVELFGEEQSWGRNDSNVSSSCRIALKSSIEFVCYLCLFL